jgi:hypothetical protein
MRHVSASLVVAAAMTPEEGLARRGEAFRLRFDRMAWVSRGRGSARRLVGGSRQRAMRDLATRSCWIPAILSPEHDGARVQMGLIAKRRGLRHRTHPPRPAAPEGHLNQGRVKREWPHLVPRALDAAIAELDTVTRCVRALSPGGLVPLTYERGDPAAAEAAERARGARGEWKRVSRRTSPIDAAT